MNWAVSRKTLSSHNQAPTAWGALEARSQGREPMTMPIAANPRRNRWWRELNWVHILWWSTIQVGVVLAPFTFTWSGLVVCLGLYVFAGLGVTMGYHRLLTHRSFKTPKIIEYFVTYL